MDRVIGCTFATVDLSSCVECALEIGELVSVEEECWEWESGACRESTEVRLGISARDVAFHWSYRGNTYLFCLDAPAAGSKLVIVLAARLGTAGVFLALVGVH